MSTNPTQPAAGRSRGRARVSTGQATVPQQPPPIQPGSQITSRPPQQTEETQRTTIPAAEPGRGRGISSTDTPSTTTAPSVSPTGSAGSGGTPAQQHSPTSESAKQSSAGRAALRGLPHQPAIQKRISALPNLDRLTLAAGEEGLEAAPQRREFKIESVLYTKPENCTGKQGETGEKIPIICNYFEVISQPNWVLFQYHVDFAPVVDSKRLRMQLMKPHDHLFQNKAFDGSTIYSLTKLDKEVTEISSTNDANLEIYTIKIKRVGEIVPTSPQFVHLFNVVFRRCMKLYGMKEIDRNYFDMKTKISIPAYYLDLINGFSTSIATYENKLMLCAELTHKLLHTATVFDKMSQIYNRSKSVENFRENCIQELVGRVIMTKYNDATYKVDDIAWDDSPESTFDRNGTPISFINYYKNQYKLDIHNIEQPLLISLPSAKDKRRGKTEPYRLVPELCVLTGIEESMRTDFRFKKAIDQYTKLAPAQRCDRLTNFINNFNGDEKVKAELDKWQMSFSKRPLQLQGRVIGPESLKFGKNVVKQLDFRADWSNDLRKSTLFSCIKLVNWVVICPERSATALNKFLGYYGNVIGPMGIYADEPATIMARNDNPDTLVNLLKDTIKEGKTQMVVVIVTSKRKDRYDAIKRICCLEKPVPSQVITSQILEDEKKGMSVVTKVAIQMNCKLGGEIWEINIPITNVMICGIDTYHDSAQKNSSVCAFIATSNQSKTKYFSRATIQQTHQELSNNLMLTVKSSLENYFRENNKYPEKIVIYRDGVGDGQLAAVKENEIPQIIKAFSLIDINYNPKLCFIIVKKRGNARFFGPDQKLGLGNPPCGTIIDTEVTRAEWFDFYLISQYASQGTVNPTHYNIIHDTIGYKAEHYQKMSFKLTHMYYNWPGTIRVPAPCQYAHKLAFLVGQSLHKEHHGSLCNKLFYL